MACLPHAVFAQDEATLRINGYAVQTPALTDKSIEALPTIAKRGETAVLIQLKTPLTAEQKLALNEAGVQLQTWLPPTAYLVRLRKGLNVALLRRAGVTGIAAVDPQWKIDRGLLGRVPKTSLQVQVQVAPGVNAAEAQKALQEAGFRPEASGWPGTLHLTLTAARLESLAQLPQIEYIQAQPTPPTPLNDRARNGSRASLLNAPVGLGGYGLNGEGVTIGVGDDGNIEVNVDFAGRTLTQASNNVGGHAAMVTGAAAGAGIVDERYRGIAAKASIVSELFDRIVKQTGVYHADHRMVVTNNSYGNQAGNDCSRFGRYEISSRTLDSISLAYPDVLHIYAAGNSGRSACAPYPVAHRTVFGLEQSAKNVLTVGATHSDGSIWAGSSRGPVRDGRLKPEITAMGADVKSVSPVNGFGVDNGTSYSAPMVSGGTALLVQAYRQIFGANTTPSAALIKALLCNGATDLGKAGPDFTYGFGWLNLRRSVEMLRRASYAESNIAAATDTRSITVLPNTKQLKAMLYWPDRPASPLAATTLVSDLDLSVTSPGGTVVMPLIADTSVAGIATPAAPGADHTNNIEQVVINDPAPGSYTLSVAVYNLPMGPASQPYVLVWDTVQSGVRITAPVAGEAYTHYTSPATHRDSVFVHWDVAPSEATGTFALHYSTDGGINWTPVSTGIPVARQQIGWFAPAVASDAVRIRLTHEQGGQQYLSGAFTLSQRPVISLATVQCPGYAALQWTPVTGATGYELMWLRGDAMEVAATVTATSHTLGSLHPDSTYWFGVRPLIGSAAVMRSISMAYVPNAGTCAGSISDGDLRLETLLSPTNGRTLTSSALTVSHPVVVRIRNLDDVPAAGFTVSYSINGGTRVVESPGVSIPAGGTLDYSFLVKPDLSQVGNYNFQTSVQEAGDLQLGNNFYSFIVRHLPNAPLSLLSPFVDDLETLLPFRYRQDTVGLAGADRYDFSNTFDKSALRTSAGTGVARSGVRAFTLEANLPSAGNAPYADNEVTGTYNLAAYSTANDDLRAVFWMYTRSLHTGGANRFEIRGKDTDPWITALDLNTIGAKTTWTQSPVVEISDLLVANGQEFSSSFAMRWMQYAVEPTQGVVRHFSIDDIRLYNAINDLEAVRFAGIDTINCALGSAHPVAILVKNTANAALTNIPVRYSIDGGLSWTVATTPSVGANSTITFTFPQAANLSAPGFQTIKAEVNFSSDNVPDNNAILLSFHNAPMVSSFPYLENFESNDGYYVSRGTASSWGWGTPVGARVNTAASGRKAWKTGLAGVYNDNEISYLYTPCFNLSGLAAPTLSFHLSLDVENGGAIFDKAWVEWTADGGATWTKLDPPGAVNWYNTTARVWSQEGYSRWHVATASLPTGHASLRLRFVFTTDEGYAVEGVGIDDVHVYDRQWSIFTGAAQSNPLTQNVVPSAWTHYTEGGAIVASLHPGASALGSTEVQAFLYGGAVRAENNQYYHHRNITVKPATATTPDSVTVRMYFLDTETEALIAATGCAGCSKPAQVTELGVSKYTDSDRSKEDGTLANNTDGVWKYTLPGKVVKVPYENGYYAEFKVKDFSEFWLNNGGPAANAPLPVRLLSFIARRQGREALLQWQTTDERDLHSYGIELRVEGSALFSTLCTVAPTNRNGTHIYAFTDATPNKSGNRYYRLRMQDNDGTLRYSGVQRVFFETSGGWQVQPNPSTGAFYIQPPPEALGEWRGAVYNDAGQRVWTGHGNREAGQRIGVDLRRGSIAPGLYFLQVQHGGETHWIKLMKQ